MHARDDAYWHPSWNDQIEENESDDGDCVTLTYDEFLEYGNESSLWSSTDESQDETCDLDEFDSQRHAKYYQQHYYDSPERESAAHDEHSCLKLKDGYYYLNPSGGGIDDFMDYNNQQIEYLDNDYYDYSLPLQLQTQISQSVQYSELTRLVENMIYDTEVVIFSKTYCPYCVTAKETFDELEQPYTVLELDQRADGEQIQWIVGQLTGGTSVPRVFVNGNFIGGGDDVQRLYESGELQEMLARQ